MVQKLIAFFIITIFSILFSMCSFNLSKYEYEYIGEYGVNMEKCLAMYPDFDTAKYAGLTLKIKPDYGYEASKTFHRLTSTKGKWYLKRIDVAVCCHLVCKDGSVTQVGRDSDRGLMIAIDSRMVGNPGAQYREPIFLYLKKTKWERM